MTNQIKNEWGVLVVQMISAINLLWIIPLCLLAGSIATGFLISTSKTNRESDIYEEGVREGMMRATSTPQTLQGYIEKTYKGDINAFIKEIGGVIYGEEPSGQLILVYIESGIELLKYKSCRVICVSGVEGNRKPIIKL